jgi:RimJ/RimL family protein N-acetyltransferase
MGRSASPSNRAGLVERLYAEHRRRMSPHFDLMITDIDRENPRSLRAHERAGFEVIDEYRGDDGQQWLIVVMDLRRPTAD